MSSFSNTLSGPSFYSKWFEFAKVAKSRYLYQLFFYQLMGIIRFVLTESPRFINDLR